MKLFSYLIHLFIVFFFAKGAFSQTISPLPPGFDSFVRELHYDSINNILFASGNFLSTSQGNINLKNIAQWNGTQWDSLGSGNTGGGIIYDMEMYQGNLLVSGSITQMGGISTPGLAQWDGNNWSSFA